MSPAKKGLCTAFSGPQQWRMCIATCDRIEFKHSGMGSTRQTPPHLVRLHPPHHTTHQYQQPTTMKKGSIRPELSRCPGTHTINNVCARVFHTRARVTHTLTHSLMMYALYIYIVTLAHTHTHTPPTRHTNTRIN